MSRVTRAAVTTPLTITNVCLLVMWAINFLWPGLFKLQISNAEGSFVRHRLLYHPMEILASEQTWGLVAIGLAFACLYGMLAYPPVMLIALLLSVSWWTLVAVVFVIGSPHGVTWEVFAAIALLLAREYVYLTNILKVIHGRITR